MDSHEWAARETPDRRTGYAGQGHIVADLPGDIPWLIRETLPSVDHCITGRTKNLIPHPTVTVAGEFQLGSRSNASRNELPTPLHRATTWNCGGTHRPAYTTGPKSERWSSAIPSPRAPGSCTWSVLRAEAARCRASDMLVTFSSFRESYLYDSLRFSHVHTSCGRPKRSEKDEQISLTGFQDEK